MKKEFQINGDSYVIEIDFNETEQAKTPGALPIHTVHLFTLDEGASGLAINRVCTHENMKDTINELERIAADRSAPGTVLEKQYPQEISILQEMGFRK